jgi:hypothetical protein
MFAVTLSMFYISRFLHVSKAKNSGLCIKLPSEEKQDTKVGLQKPFAVLFTRDADKCFGVYVAK